jgi:hypothetical protein
MRNPNPTALISSVTGRYPDSRLHKRVWTVAASKVKVWDISCSVMARPAKYGVANSKSLFALYDMFE